MINKPDKPETINGHKKAYSKPELIQFPLRPEEAVLGHCKTSGYSGPAVSGSCTSGSNCSTLGS